MKEWYRYKSDRGTGSDRDSDTDRIGVVGILVVLERYYGWCSVWEMDYYKWLLSKIEM